MKRPEFLSALHSIIGLPSTGDPEYPSWDLPTTHGTLEVSMSHPAMDSFTVFLRFKEHNMETAALGAGHFGKWNVVQSGNLATPERVLAELQRRLGLAGYVPPGVHVQKEAPPHDLYKTGDPGVPDSITDGYGEVVLGLCRRCGRAEVELDEPCIVENPGDPNASLVGPLTGGTVGRAPDLMMPTPDPEPIRTIYNALPDDVKRKVSLHDLKRIHDALQPKPGLCAADQTLFRALIEKDLEAPQQVTAEPLDQHAIEAYRSRLRAALARLTGGGEALKTGLTALRRLVQTVEESTYQRDPGARDRYFSFTADSPFCTDQELREAKAELPPD
jgi:hypothetical protein